MKKILGITSLFLVFELIGCIIAGFALKVPVDVPSSGIFAYKFATVFELFFRYLPPIIFTGFTASCSVHFGHNSEGSLKRFSGAMLKRFKLVMISALICTCFLTLSQEVFCVLVERRKTEIVNQPKMLKEMLKVGNNLYSEGLYSRAQKYASSVLKMDPNSKEARDLMGKAEMEIKRLESEDIRFDLANAKPLVEDDNSLKIDTASIIEVKDCLEKSQKAFENQQWFDAHYYAESGKKLITSKDPNYDILQELSTTAWNNLEADYKTAKTENQLQYEDKFKGYTALMNKDDLQAYYIFRELNESSEMAHDPDVAFYYNISKDRIEQKVFFIDETFELKSFENANDVYFAYTRLSGSKDIVYYKGATEVQHTGQTIQYLRDLTIVSFDYKGNWIKTMHCPYAKTMAVSVKDINSVTKTILEIDDSTEYVPYILLKSVGRDDSNQVFQPEFFYADGEEHLENDYILFPMSFDDFLMLENATLSPETTFIGNLVKFVSKSEKFGFSQAKYGQIVLNRLLYPLFLLILFIFLAAFGWNNRIGPTQYFKFSWIFGFPLIIFIEFLFYELMMFVFRLLNYVFLGFTGSLGAILFGVIFYVITLFIVSIYFLGRKSSN